MKRFLCAFAVCLAVVTVSVAEDTVPQIQGGQVKRIQGQKGDKIDKDKLVGVWEVKKLPPDLGPAFVNAKRMWEFKKDGTLEVSLKADPKNVKLTGEDGKEIQLPGDFVLPLGSGKYEVDGNKLTITLTMKQLGNKEFTRKTTITKLTDKEFQTKDEKGKVSEFTKKTEE